MIANRIVRRRHACPGGSDVREHSGDSGFTLVEMLVAMGIFSIVLTVVGAGIVSMTHSTARVQATSDTTNEARRAFSLFDKQIRYASGINPPVQVDGNWYVELLTDATGSTGNVQNPSRCHQWRLQSSTDTLELRSWDMTGIPTGWGAVAHYVVNDPDTDTPFVFHPSENDRAKQRLDVLLSLQRGEAPMGRLQSTFVARNTDSNTITNLTGRVCTGMGQP